MIYKRWWYVLLLCIPFWFMMGEKFTVKKEKISVSCSTLRQQCCQEWAEILNLIPSLLRQVAAVQENGMEQLNGYVCNDNNSLLLMVDKEELQKIKAQLDTLRESLENTIQRTDKQIAFFSSMRQSKKK